MSEKQNVISIKVLIIAILSFCVSLRDLLIRKIMILENKLNSPEVDYLIMLISSIIYTCSLVKHTTYHGTEKKK